MLKIKVFDGYTASDIEEEMNRFFSENPQLTKNNIEQLQLKMTQKYSEAIKGNEIYIIALMMYSLPKGKIAAEKK
jgi:uncharacterized protein YneF (UPF0154 family)